MATNLEAVIDDLRCDICTEIFVDPKVLPCHHTFCFICIQTLYNRTESLRCPICRFNVRSIDALPPNIYIDRLVSHVKHGREDDEDIIEDDEMSSTVNNWAPEQDEISRLIDVAPTEETEPSCCLSFSQSTRQVCRNAVAQVWLFLQELCIDMAGMHHKKLLEIIVLLSVLNIGRLVAGAVTMQSACSLEGHIGVFLFVKAMLALFSWGYVLFFRFLDHLEEAARNSFTIIYFTLDMLFALGWLSYGTHLVFVRADWDSCTQVNFYQFSRFLVSVDWIGCVAFMFFLLYRLCSNERYGQ